MSTQSKILREFDLDAPELDKEPRSAFRSQTRFITSNIERKSPKIKNDAGIWKIIVEVVPIIRKKHPRNLLGALVVQVKGDPEAYLSMETGMRESLAPAWLIYGLQLAFNEYGWPINEITDAAQKVAADNYRNTWPWKKNIINGMKSAAVDVVVEWGDKKAEIVAIFKSPSGEINKKITICSHTPNEFAFVPCLGTIKWIDENRIKLTSRSGAETWSVG